jgi:alpha/beta superfamily hydrolase
MSELPLYLGDGHERMFAVYHPADGTGCAVLLCPPFGWDDICSYRSRRVWAERLAAHGYPTLRFDLPATGDSAGSGEQGGSIDVWVDAVAAAASWLRGVSGRRRTTALGIGLGGLLALRAAADDAPIDDLVLWAVPADGRRLLRELRAFARVEAESLAALGAPPAQPGEPVAPGGFVLGERLQEALESLDGEALLPPRTNGRRILALGRDGVPPDGALIVQLERSAAVTTGRGSGYGAMMAPPDLARPPLETFAEVDAWLAAADDPRAVQGTAPPNGSTLELEVDGLRISETPVRLAAGEQQLFAVLGEPLSAPRSDVALVLLNAGAIRRIGPNRMWVDIARRWTARGVTTLRLDVEGIGDATGDGQRYTDVSELYVPSFVGQVQLALDGLADRGGIDRFVLLGLCSGAFWGFHTALADTRVSSAVMLNPRVLHWHPRLDASRDARQLGRRVHTLRFWQRDLRRAQTYALRLLPFARWLLWRALRPSDRPVAKALAQIVRSFDRLRDSGQTAVLVFCDGEPLRDELEAGGLLSDTSRWPNLAVELLPGRDHTFRPLWMHPYVHEAVDRALEREVARTARRTVVAG